MFNKITLNSLDDLKSIDAELFIRGDKAVPSNRNSARRQSLMVAFCGMAAGLSVVIMLLGGVIPIATYAVPMLCGLLLLPILIEFGKTAAWATFFAVAALALLLGFDKEAAFFYLFIGYYPIVKWDLDKIKPKGLRIAVKLLLFTGAIVIMYALLNLLFPLDAYLNEFQEMGVIMTIGFVVVYDICMLLYDWALMGCVMIYANKIRPKMAFLRKN